MKYLTKLMERFGLASHTTAAPPPAPAAEAPVADVVSDASDAPSIDGD